MNVSKLSNTKIGTLYDEDYYLWLETTLKQLQVQNFPEVDWINLIEEIEYMVKREKRSLESNLEIVIMHLLKYKYQIEKRSNSWRYTIFEHRDRIEKAIEDSPSLQPYLEQILEKCYSKARKKAALETDLPINIFPLELPFTLEETLNPDYLPE